MIVSGASAALAALLNDGDARRRLVAEASLATPHVADAEVAHALRRHALTGAAPADDLARALAAWQALAVLRYAVTALVGRVWELRADLSGYDAAYVALAEALERPLVTADARLARAPGPRCPISVVTSGPHPSPRRGANGWWR